MIWINFISFESSSIVVALNDSRCSCGNLVFDVLLGKMVAAWIASMFSLIIIILLVKKFMKSRLLCWSLILVLFVLCFWSTSQLC